MLPFCEYAVARLCLPCSPHDKTGSNLGRAQGGISPRVKHANTVAVVRARRLFHAARNWQQRDLACISEATDSIPRRLLLIIPPVTRGWAPVTGYPLSLSQSLARRRDTCTLASGSFLRRRLAFLAAAPRASILRENRGVGSRLRVRMYLSNCVCLAGHSATETSRRAAHGQVASKNKARGGQSTAILGPSQTPRMQLRLSLLRRPCFVLDSVYLQGRGSLPCWTGSTGDLPFCPQSQYNAKSCRGVGPAACSSSSNSILPSLA